MSIVTGAERMREASQKIADFFAAKMGLPRVTRAKVVNIKKAVRTKNKQN